MSYEYFIGKRYLRTKEKNTFISLISFLSIAGVAVGVMALIIVIAVMAGFETELKSRILGIESHIVVMRYGGISDYKNTVKEVESVEGVEAATPFIYTQVAIRSGTGVSGAVLRGIDPNSAGRVIKSVNPDFLKKSEENAPPIILGVEMAKRMKASKGSQIHLISSGGMLSPIGHLPSMKRFTVSGFFETGMYEFDNSLVYVSLDSAKKIVRSGDNVTGIEVRVKDVDKARYISKEIKKKIGHTYWTKDWSEMNKNLFSALRLEKTVMFIILALIILVAAFNIASSLIMMVMQKTRDIAMLKAMGAADRSIKKIFIFKGMIIGGIGTCLGAIFGFIACALLEHYKFIDLPGDVYPLSTLPVHLEFSDVFITALCAMAICFLSTLYPARQASKLNPVEALRYG